MSSPQRDVGTDTPPSVLRTELAFRDVGGTVDEERQRAQVALSSSEARFRLLVDGIRDYAVFMIGPNGSVSSWNRGAERILGYRPDEIIGSSIDVLHTESDRELSVSSEYLRLAERFGRYEQENWRVRKDGTRFWAHDTLSALFDDAGLVGFAVVMRDLSERRQAEDALKAHSERMSNVIRMQQRIAVTSLDAIESMEGLIREIGAMIRADGTALALAEDDELVYHMTSGLSSRYHNLRIDLRTSPAGIALQSGEWLCSNGKKISPLVRQAMETRKGVGSLIMVPLVYDGRGLGVLDIVYGAPDAFDDDDLDTLQLVSGQIAAAVSHMLSFRAKQVLIMERTRALTAMRDSEERFRSLIENASDTIEILDRDLVVRYASPAAEPVLGYQPEELVGKSIREILHPEDFQRLSGIVAEIAAVPRASAEIELRKQHKSGAWRSMNAVARNLLDDPAIHGLVLTCHDVTERNILAAQLRQAQKMDAIGQLAGGVAHDFNNLLTVIKGNADLMRMELDPASGLHTEIEEVRTAADRAAGLTRQLLAFSRKQLLHAREVDVNELVQEFRPMLGRLIGEDVDIRTELAPRLEPVLADPGQIHQVLMNLAVNARDAMPGGGILTIATSTVQVDDAYIEAHAPVAIKPGQYVQLSVSDTGAGMSAEVRVRIFEPFFTTKDPGRGTGLGLATVYGIVKQSGGFIWVETAPGKGSTFQIIFPAVARSTDARTEKQEAADDPRGSETILLIEDEAPLRALATRVLQRYGYRVLVASNGAEALAIASAHEGPIHLVVCDVVMPGMNGREAAGRLRTLRPEARLLYMSGYTDDEILRRGLLDPNLRMLEKPFSSSTLAHTVRSVLDGEHAPA